MRTKTPELDRRILDAAARLFAGNQFHTVRMEDISAEAEVGKGTLYRYFKDKEALYLALLKRAAGEMQERVRRIRDGGHGPLIRLERLVEEIFAFFDEQRHIFELIQQVEASRGVRHPWQKVRDLINEEVLAAFDDGRRAGLFTLREPATTALLLLGGIRALIRFGPSERSRDLPQQLVHTVLYGADMSKRTGGQ